MASVFTYDPDPPRVSSPWLLPEDSSKKEPRQSPDSGTPSLHQGLLSEYGLTKLEAEPQQGPTEYKLHLLLRPRRAYLPMSTTGRANDSQRGRSKEAANFQKPSPPTLSSSNQPRQQRLQHLTTQLLWRLQQSSPYHATSSKELTIPRLPDDTVDLNKPVKADRLVPGLEESRGALYEIGVSDDGTLVGLTKDEMDESISTLRVMAASLGCHVEVVRMIIVGDCEWIEEPEADDSNPTASKSCIKNGKLWVAEALVTPNLGLRHGDDADKSTSPDVGSKNSAGSLSIAALPSRGSSATPQLRITFTGPTTSGKSSLLGTLSTGTLDNGRGKSRLSLLKHRHEMVSGVTSSIAQELIGYKDWAILNFAHGNIESWVDIHDRSEDGRLVFVSDSGGHPRYRRTVLRGLMNWAPHWSVLCIAADDADEASRGFGATSSARDILGAAAATIDLVQAHLTLSLKLDVPMAVVITKLDLASRTSLQKTMGKVLTAIKDAGRTPKILQPDQRQHDELDHVPLEDHEKVQSVVDSMTAGQSLTKYVPIVLTSVVKGTGIGLVHALLESLPLPPLPTQHDFIGMALNPEQPESLFHIDDTFSLPASYGALAGAPASLAEQGVVVSGHLRFGNLSVGDKIVVGPFPSEDEESRGSAPDDRSSPSTYGLSISHPSSAELARVAMKNAVSASAIAGEWHHAQIVSIRNLRLPVRRLEAGQAGSIGLVFDPDQERVDPAWQAPRIRRGMVLAVPSKHMINTGLSLQAASGFTATFNDSTIGALMVGSLVNVYVASVRAAARVLGVTRHRPDHKSRGAAAEDMDIFSLTGDVEEEGGVVGSGSSTADGAEVFLELLHNREWIEMGSRVIILEGGSQDRSGLEGYVGKVIEIVD